MRSDLRLVVGLEDSSYLFSKVEVLPTPEDEIMLRVLFYFLALVGHA
jgi:hypothetical protein